MCYCVTIATVTGYHRNSKLDSTAAHEMDHFLGGHCREISLARIRLIVMGPQKHRPYRMVTSCHVVREVTARDAQIWQKDMSHDSGGWRRSKCAVC